MITPTASNWLKNWEGNRACGWANAIGIESKMISKVNFFIKIFTHLALNLPSMLIFKALTKEIKKNERKKRRKA